MTENERFLLRLAERNMKADRRVVMICDPRTAAGLQRRGYLVIEHIEGRRISVQLTGRID